MEKYNVTMIDQFMSIDLPFRQHLLTRMIQGIAYSLVIVIVSILTRYILLALFGVAVLLIFFGVFYYQILLCTDGICRRYDGTCVAVKRTKSPFDPSLIVKLTDGTFLEVMGKVKTRNYTEGCQVSLYFSYKSLFQITEDTYRCNSVSYIHVVKNNYDAKRQTVGSNISQQRPKRIRPFGS